MQSGNAQTSASCTSTSSGDVKIFLTRNPCKEYAVASISLHKDTAATQAVISWTVLPNPTLAGQYKALVDQKGTGNPPGESAIFDGLCYASGEDAATVWAAQVLPTGDVAADRQILEAIAPAKLSPGYLAVHCIA